MSWRRRLQEPAQDSDHGLLNVEIDESMVVEDVRILFNEQLGHGGYGVVYEGDWRGTPVAVKRVHSQLVDDEVGTQQRHAFLESFSREWRMFGHLRHPFIVQFLGVFEARSRSPSIVMELMDTTLRKRCQRAPYFSEKTTVRLCGEVLCGLVYLHARNIVHRDLTTNNVLLTRGEDPTAKISDLGVARALFGDDPRRRVLLSQSQGMSRGPGAIPYMSPESMDDSGRPYNTKHDIFSFGVLALSTSTRHEPTCFNQPQRVPLGDGSGNTRIVPEVERRAVDLRDLPRTHSLCTIILECLRNSPSERPTAREILTELERLPVPTTPSSGLPVDDQEDVEAELARVRQALLVSEQRSHELADRERAAQEDAQRLQNHLTTAQQENVRLQQELMAAEQELTEVNHRAQVTEERAMAAELRVTRVDQQVTTRGQQLTITQIQLVEANQRAQAAEQQLMSTEQQMATLKQKLTEASQRAQMAEQQAKTAEEQVTTTEQQLITTQQRLTTARQRLIEANQRELAAEQRATSAEQRAATAERQVTTTEQQLTTMQQRLITARQQLTEANQRVEVVEQQMKTTKRQATRTEQNLNKTNQRAQRAEERVTIAERECASLLSQQEQLMAPIEPATSQETRVDAATSQASVRPLSSYCWRNLPNIPGDGKRKHHTVHIGEWVVLVGGEDERLRRCNRVYAYNYTTKRWCEWPRTPYPRCSAGSDGHHLYALGGQDPSSLKGIKSVYRLSDNRTQWLSMPDMPHPIMYRRGVAFHKHKLFVCCDDENHPERLQVYDFSEQCWSVLPGECSTGRRQDCKNALVPWGNYLVANDMTYYDVESGQWHALPHRRSGTDACSVAVINGLLIAVGSAGSYPSEAVMVDILESVRSNWPTSSLPRLPSERRYVSSCTANNALFVTGGMLNERSFLCFS